MSERQVKNVILLVSDTVRYDYLGLYGGHVRTDALNELAARSAVFERHYAVSYPTIPARFDMLTGQPAFPEVGWNALPRSVSAVPDLLRARGMRTLGIVDVPFYTARGFNYDRGFQYYWEHKERPAPGMGKYYLGTEAGFPRIQDPVTGALLEREWVVEAEHAAPTTMRVAEDWLEAACGDPFFMLIDTWDPHEPWDAPDHYVRHYVEDYRGERLYPPYKRWSDAGWSERDVYVARGLYSAKLEMVDRWIGRVLDKLTRLGIEHETAIIFTSDHGFYFGEHGYVGKMHRTQPWAREWLRSPLYEEVARTPLIVHIPGEESRRVNGLTSALDVGPTILELLGVEIPEGMFGQSLVPAAKGGDYKGHEGILTSVPLANLGDEIAVVDDFMRRIAEWQPITLTTREWSLLSSVPGEPIELYHLPSDPRQEVNLAADEERVVADLRNMYTDLLIQFGTPAEVLDPRRGT